MSDTELLARLKAHRTLGHAPLEELEWVAAHGHPERVEAGELDGEQRDPVDALWIVFSGRMSIRVDRGAGPRKVLEWVGGDAAGLLPYSRVVVAPGDVLIEEAVEFLRVDRAHFRELTTTCPEITTALVHVMLDRARRFTSDDFQTEKIMSLGRLAAGLAHELNNPASAVVRGAKALRRQLDDLETAARAIGAAGLTPAAVETIDRVRQQCEQAGGKAGRSPVERADREDAIETWLRAHHVERADIEALARSSVTMDTLDGLAAALDERTLPVALRAVTTSRVARQTAAEVEVAASRIHALVSAVKGFSRLDQAAAPAVVSVAQGLRDTLAVHSSKARARDVSVTIEVAPDVPKVCAVESELNQVWANLLDNALDAAPDKSHVRVVACRRVDGKLVVKFIDAGLGIPEKLQPLIFDQFFTTKPFGEGTGLGLDTARRLVRRFDGQIEFDSRPGLTEFRVTLPPAATP
jgi:signal transduction histidine kinase